MKASKVFVIIMFAGICLFSCKKVQTPERVTGKFLNHYENKEFEKAKAYGTKSTQSLLETLISFEELRNHFGETEKVEPRKISGIECLVDADKAICIFYADDEQGELDLVKKDGKWLVDMKKESPFDEHFYEEDIEISED